MMPMTQVSEVCEGRQVGRASRPLETATTSPADHVIPPANTSQERWQSFFPSSILDNVSSERCHNPLCDQVRSQVKVTVLIHGSPTVSLPARMEERERNGAA
ncbi:hypothetical protein E2C01_081505 [Portunus trituberculatus]|uniref:Uncharacterized protein n=1 Tax=Portunus trituberculatus TaxID=210409 RepID=A0A5B7IWU4_PORTR|nr:hypothetical protein [Portunus trituberculatus]